MTKWSLGTYNRFIKSARKAGGLSVSQARQAYRELRDHLGRPASRVDLKRHPRISKRVFKSVTYRPPRKVERAPEGPVETIQRKSYKPKGKREVHLEIVRQGGQIKKVVVDGRAYRTPKDFRALASLITAAS